MNKGGPKLGNKNCFWCGEAENNYRLLHYTHGYGGDGGVECSPSKCITGTMYESSVFSSHKTWAVPYGSSPLVITASTGGRSYRLGVICFSVLLFLCPP